MKHLIKIDSTPHGVLGVRHAGHDQQYCEAGETVILEWQPDAGWGLQEAHYTDGNGNVTAIDLTPVKIDGKDVVAFTMPNANINVGGTFKKFVLQDWTEGKNPSTGEVLTVGDNGEPTPKSVDELANEISEGDNDLVDALDKIISSAGKEINVDTSNLLHNIINYDGTYATTTLTVCVLLPFSQYAGKRIAIKRQYTGNINISYLTSNNLVVGQVAPFCKGMWGRQVYYDSQQTTDDDFILETIPSDCNYIFVLYDVNTSNHQYRMPKFFEFEQIDKASAEGLAQLEKSSYAHEKRFRVMVETNQPQLPTDESFTIDQHLTSHVYPDNCVLYLPESYSPWGTPTKLIIFCKQGGTKIGAEASDDYYQSTRGQSPILSLPIFGYLLSLGYAIVAADGEPDGWLEALNLGTSSASGTTEADLRVSGNYVAVQSTKKAYDYVVSNFNIDTNGAFLFGYSQGGQYAQNVLDLSGIPILAVAEMSPVCSFQFNQWDLVTTTKTIGNITNCTRASRLNIARMFGFGDNITTNAQLLALQYNDYKQYLIGFDPWTRDVVNPFSDFEQDGNIYKFADGVTVDDVDMVKYAKAPLKVWCAEGDTSLGVDVMKAFVKAIKNGGGVADICIYPQQTNSHRFYEYQTTQGSVTVNGVSYNYTAVAIDIAVWFRSFGGY